MACQCGAKRGHYPGCPAVKEAHNRAGQSGRNRSNRRAVTRQVRGRGK